jgi:integrase
VVAIVGALPPRLRLAVLRGAWCALRYGEVAELRRADIDPGKGLIGVRRGVSWPDGKATVWTPKTKAGMLDVHIPPHVLPSVKEHLQEFTGSGPEALPSCAVGGAHASPRLWQGACRG